MGTHAKLVRRWIGIFNDRDFEACAVIGADEYVEHAIGPFGRVASGRVNGPTYLRETAEWLLAQFPDIHMTLDAIVAEGDLVTARVTSTGTNLGPIGPFAPTGRRFASQQCHWFRVADGRLAEHWAVRDDLVTMLQLGVIAPPSPPAGGSADQ